MNREVWYGSPAAAALDTDAAAADATITWNEATRYADLDRLVAWAHADNIATTIGYSGFNLVDALQVTEIELYGSEPVVVGRNTATAAVPLNPLRPRPRFLRLGKRAFGTNDTLKMSAAVKGTNIEGSYGIAVPGISGLAAPSFVPSRAPQILGEGGGAEVSAAGSATLTFTADRAGWVLLDDFMLSALQDATAEAEIGAPNPLDGLSGLYITSFDLPGSDPLVRGSGTPTVPAAVYSIMRPANLIKHGFLRMDAGAQISVGVTNVGPDIVNVAGGFPFWSDDGKGGAHACK